MTTTPPPRRRRIAGERRRPASEPDAQQAPAGAPEAPVTLAKAPVAPATPVAPPADPSAPAPSKRRRLLPTGRRSPGTTEGSDTGRTSAGSSRAPGWWGSPVTVAVLAVALVVMLTLVGLGAFGLLGNSGVQDLREADEAVVAAESAPSVAERAAEAILAYDHRSLDADQDAATKFMTGDFAEEYSTTFERTVASAARTYRAQVTAQVRGSSVVRAGADEVKVLLFVDQTTKSTAHPRPQVALNRVEFVMVEQDGEWLVDDISSY